VVLVAVLFGSTLFGILGALLAIPAAASIQIAVHELMEYRRETAEAEAKKKSSRRTRKKPRGPKKSGGPTPAPEVT